MRKKSKFSVTCKDRLMVDLVSRASHKTLAVRVIDCIQRVMPYFYEKYPDDL